MGEYTWPKYGRKELAKSRIKVPKCSPLPQRGLPPCEPDEGCVVAKSDQEIFSTRLDEAGAAPRGVCHEASRAQFDIRPDNCTPSFGGMTNTVLIIGYMEECYFPPNLKPTPRTRCGGGHPPIKPSQK